MRVYGQLNLRPVCFVYLLQDLDFNKEKVEVVSLGAGAEKVPPIDGLLPLRVPIIGGSTKGWMLPNARRGAEQVAVEAAELEAQVLALVAEVVLAVVTAEQVIVQAVALVLVVH